MRSRLDAEDIKREVKARELFRADSSEGFHLASL